MQYPKIPVHLLTHITYSHLHWNRNNVETLQNVFKTTSWSSTSRLTHDTFFSRAIPAFPGHTKIWATYGKYLVPVITKFNPKVYLMNKQNLRGYFNFRVLVNHILFSICTLADCASFHAMACSLPPFPISKTFAGPACGSISGAPIFGFFANCRLRVRPTTVVIFLPKIELARQMYVWS